MFDWITPAPPPPVNAIKTIFKNEVSPLAIERLNTAMGLKDLLGVKLIVSFSCLETMLSLPLFFFGISFRHALLNEYRVQEISICPWT